MIPSYVTNLDELQDLISKTISSNTKTATLNSLNFNVKGTSFRVNEFGLFSSGKIKLPKESAIVGFSFVQSSIAEESKISVDLTFEHEDAFIRNGIFDSVYTYKNEQIVMFDPIKAPANSTVECVVKNNLSTRDCYFKVYFFVGENNG